MNWEIISLVSGFLLLMSKIADIILVHHRGKMHEKIINLWVYFSEVKIFNLVKKNISNAISILEIVYNEKSKNIIHKALFISLIVVLISIPLHWISVFSSDSDSDFIILPGLVATIIGGFFIPFVISFLVTYSLLKFANKSHRISIIFLILFLDFFVALFIVFFESFLFVFIVGHYAFIYVTAFALASLLPTFLHMILNLLSISLYIVIKPFIFFSEKVFFIAGQKINNNIITIIIGSYLLPLNLLYYLCKFFSFLSI